MDVCVPLPTSHTHPCMMYHDVSIYLQIFYVDDMIIYVCTPSLGIICVCSHVFVADV